MTDEDKYDALNEAAKASASMLDLMEHADVSEALDKIAESVADAVLIFRDLGADPMVTIAAVSSAANGSLLNAILATTESEQ